MSSAMCFLPVACCFNVLSSTEVLQGAFYPASIQQTYQGADFSECRQATDTEEYSLSWLHMVNALGR
jgi:hypothetical protein